MEENNRDLNADHVKADAAQKSEKRKVLSGNLFFIFASVFLICFPFIDRRTGERHPLAIYLGLFCLPFALSEYLKDTGLDKTMAYRRFWRAVGQIFKTIWRPFDAIFWVAMKVLKYVLIVGLFCSVCYFVFGAIAAIPVSVLLTILIILVLFK